MFWYYVAPYANDKWNILFENQPKPYIYGSREEAIAAALQVAERNFKKTQAPSGVKAKVEEGGRWHDEGTFGEE